MKLQQVVAILLSVEPVTAQLRSLQENCTKPADMTQEIAKGIIDRALAKSKELKVKMNIAVVDKGANLVSFIRMDGAWLGSVDIAQKKAKTSAFFNKESGWLGENSQPGHPLFNIEHSNNGLITFPGGVPIKNDDGDLIGAVGVSGDTVEKDDEVANYGVSGDTVEKDANAAV